MYGTQRGTPWGYSLYEFKIDTGQTTGIKDTNAGVIPKQFALHQNYPNPFNPSTTIQYQIPKANHVTLNVFDVLGREVATLVNEQKPAGTYTVQFEGSGLTSGVYFYRLQSGTYSDTKKLVLLR
jgi:hypothetical protein